MTAHRTTIAISLVLLAVFVIMLVFPMTALASVKGRRNTAIGLGAGALYSAIRGHAGAAIVLGAGAAYAYHRYAQERQREARRHRYSAYYNRSHYYRRHSAY